MLDLELRGLRDRNSALPMIPDREPADRSAFSWGFSVIRDKPGDAFIEIAGEPLLRAQYHSAKGHTFMDRRLFLPQEWASDRQRREEAGVPVGLIFRTKPELALEMAAGAVSEGIPFRWVGGDSIYGNIPTFVQGVRQLGEWYVLDISSEAHVWTKQPQVIPPEQRPKQSRGRSHTKALVVGKSEQVDQVIAGLQANSWRPLTVAEGSQGPLVYEYAEVWVWFSEEGLPGPRERLLERRSLGQEPELKYHRSNAPAEVPLLKLS